MRKDKQERHEKLVSLIQQQASDPGTAFNFEGFAWACLSQSEWADRLNLSDRTLRELAKIPPIVATKTIVDHGRVRVLYRIGSESHESVRHVANVMSKMFRDKYGKRVSRDQYGCLCGLAEIWPQGLQPTIFKLVLNDFVSFRQGVKVADPESEYIERYYEYVPIQLVRKYPKVALEMYEMHLQKSGIAPPPILIATNPKKWISPLTGKPFANSGGLQEALKTAKLPDASSPQ